MSVDRWRSIERVYHEALARPAAERGDFLAHACAGDEGLRAEVESLLAQPVLATDALEKAAAGVAAQLLGRHAPGMLVGRRLGPYQILAPLGAGGMGEVYKARDARLRRDVAVKVLSPHLIDSPQARERFQREARAVAALQHPNICTIYDVGATDEGHSFLVMELLVGETVQQRVRRGRFAASDVIDLGIALADALDAAHTAGIVHRDIKPANIFLSAHGPKVLDFGLVKANAPHTSHDSAHSTAWAQTLTEHGSAMGTVAYMSPEVLRGDPVDARTDLFSFGLVLYEMATGTPTFSGATAAVISAAILHQAPAAPRSLAPDLPAGVEAIILKALDKDRALRYQRAAEIRGDLQRLKRDAAASSSMSASAPHVAPARGYRWMALALVLVALAATAAFLYLRSSPALTEKDSVLLADFVNTTGEPVFDGGTLKQALMVQLQQTPFMNLVPEEAVRETLRYMERPVEAHITRDLGGEICQRQGLTAMIVGTIASLGRNYVITLEAVSGRTGSTIVSEQVEADGKERVLKALEEAAVGLRRKLGESLTTLEKYNVRIEQATTSSLEALKLYSAGFDQFVLRGDARGSIPLLVRATELDPNFALALDTLAWAYVNLGDYGKTVEHTQRAFALRDRVTDIERYYVTDTYYHWAIGDWEQQNEGAQLAKQLFPNDWNPPHNLAINYTNTGQDERAIVEEREAIRLNPNVVHPYRFMANALEHLNRFDEASDVIRQTQAKKLDGPFFRQSRFRIAFAQNDAQEMTRQLDLIRQNEGDRAALQMQARAAAFGGRWRDAVTLYRRAVDVARPAGSVGELPPLPLEATIRASLFGLCQHEQATAQALSLSRVVSGGVPLSFAVREDGSLCGDAVRAQALAGELAMRYPMSTPTIRSSLPVLRGSLELLRNRPDQALEFLRPATGQEPTYIRGQAYLRLRRGAEAAAEFQKVLERRGLDALTPVYPMAYLGLARAHALEGNITASRKAYEDFLAAWKDADADLPVLIAAKQEYGRLN